MLHDATIEHSLFQGVTVPALVMAQLGTLRVEQNTVRNSYGGFWFVSMADPALVTVFDLLATGNPDLYLAFAKMGAAALLDRLFVIATAIWRVLPATPPLTGRLVPGTIAAPTAAQLTLAHQTISNFYAQAKPSGTSGTGGAAARRRGGAAADKPDTVRSREELKNVGRPDQGAPSTEPSNAPSTTPRRLGYAQHRVRRDHRRCRHRGVLGPQARRAATGHQRHLHQSGNRDRGHSRRRHRDQRVPTARSGQLPDRCHHRRFVLRCQPAHRRPHFRQGVAPAPRQPAAQPLP